MYLNREQNHLQQCVKAFKVGIKKMTEWIQPERTGIWCFQCTRARMCGLVSELCEQICLLIKKREKSHETVCKAHAKRNKTIAHGEEIVADFYRV